MSQLKNNSLTLYGPTSNAILSVQDGNGRIQLKWNGTNEFNTKYIVSNEPALFIDMNCFFDDYFKIKFASPGNAGNIINYDTHLSILKNGNIGIGNLTKSEITDKLVIDGSIKLKNKITLKGKNSDAILSVQDGNGRIQLKWNGTNELNTKYIVSNEDALFIDMNCFYDNYYNINFANKGNAGDIINFETHFSIKKNGNIGIGTIEQSEKLDVNGNIKCNNIIFNDNTFYNNLATNSTFVNTLSQSLNNGNNIFQKVKLACSTGKMIINNNSYTCSGTFISLDDNDLQYGLFLTAAHCVMEISGSPPILYKATSFYVTNPINNYWTQINVNNIYYDGIADVALIRTDIDLTEHSDKVLRLSNSDPVTGDICYLCGDPSGFDTDSMVSGIIRDANYCDTGGYQITDTLFISTPGIGGNSGSAILNYNGDIIGIFTFGYSNLETYGGGSNLSTLRKTLDKLKTFQNNRFKKYLGINFYVPSPYTLANKYTTPSFPNQGLYISQISTQSPFNNILQVGDIVLSATAGNNTYQFGHINNQKTIGVLLYEYDVSTISITYIRGNTQQTSIVPFTTTYASVSTILDGPLQGGLLGNTQNRPDNKLKLNKIKTIF